MKTQTIVTLLAGILACAATVIEAAEPLSSVIPNECLVLAPLGRGGRVTIPADAVWHSLATGNWKKPAAGDNVALPGGATVAWETLKAEKPGAFQHKSLEGGYAFLSVPAQNDEVMILEASGHRMAFINGEPRVGDIYQHGYVHIPIKLHKGDNELLFHCGRGQLNMKLVAPRTNIYLDPADTTLPDSLVDEPVNTHGALMLVNATDNSTAGLTLQVTCNGLKSIETHVSELLPCSLRKVVFPLVGPAPKATGSSEVEIKLMEGRRTVDICKLKLEVRNREQLHRRTFISSIDGSVQYYAIQPAHPPAKDGDRPALFFTLHGASVQGDGQAAAYSGKSWGHIVAPTNRRPYGFDWEDWGRLDALEVLQRAQKELHTDPQRVYLTGHSMGGHGTWHLGALFPDKWAAIGPSAGWVSMFSYAGAARPEGKTAIEEILNRSTATSDTRLFLHNYASHGVYVLHGDKDDNVPVEQARQMKEWLSEFHRDFAYFEQPGAGHWWSNTDEPGAACVDWAPMFDFFAHHIRPAADSLRNVDFTTVNPAVSSRCYWLSVEGLEKQGCAGRAIVRQDPWQRRFVGTTANMVRLSLDLRPLQKGEKLSVELDGQKIANIPWPESDRLYLRRTEDRWTVSKAPPLSEKGPHRYGGFKDAFRNRMVFVYGTTGNSEENAWARSKARFDAEVFWYQGNGSIDVVADAQFDPGKECDRNVILYGNADTNSAWKNLLGDSPVQVRRGQAAIGDHMEKGEATACLFVRPRPGSDGAMVGIVSGTGLPGMHATDKVPYFVSGTGYPDCLVFGVEALEKGIGGIRAAGFFGFDWSVKHGDFAVAKEP